MVHGEEWNNYEIPGREVKGVYNSADECFVASYFFNLEEEQFGELICVCSPNQVARKTLFYLENGVMPQVYSVPVDKMFHNIVGEVFDQIPYILLKDHNWQSSDSKEANRTRCERMPGYAEE